MENYELIGQKGSIEWYRYFWLKCSLSKKENELRRIDWALNKATKNTERYKRVSEITYVPWQLIAAIHGLESSFNFNCHLHNGDSLSSRTIHIPAGRPKTHEPPFTWEESAIDALKYDGLAGRDNWNIYKMLQFAEKYNGLGYLKYRATMSPYLWSCTNIYGGKGKYVADGRFDPEAKDDQVGVAALFRALGMVSEDEQQSKPITVPYLVPTLEQRIARLEERITEVEGHIVI